ncbi:MAG: Slp family lipoprotein [Methylococcaceae bacterium]
MKLLLICLSLLLSACSSLPPAIEDAPKFDLSYSSAIQNLAQYKDVPVRWGGVIIDIENEQAFSLIQVLLYPLGSYGRPRLDLPNEGRFFIKSPDFLDPLVYKKDGEITVAGTLNGTIERTIGKKTLQLPLIASTVIHLWPKYDMNRYYYGGWGYGYNPYYGYGGYGYNPYYWGSGFGWGVSSGFYRPYWY